MSNRSASRYGLRSIEPIMGPYRSYHELLSQVASDLARDLSEIAKGVEELAPKLKDVLPIFRLGTMDASNVRIVAIDAGSNGKDLLLGYQPFSVAVGAVFAGVMKKGEPFVATVKPPRSYFDDEEGVKLASLLGYYLMYRLGNAMLDDADILMLDGPLYLPRNYYGPKGRAYTSAYYEVYDAALRSLAELLKTARRKGKDVVGVVKRIRSSYITSWLGMSGYPDSWLTSRLLSDGEALGPLSIDPRWEDVAQWLDNPGLYRPWAIFLRKGSKVARIDIPEYALDNAGKLASVIYSISDPATGLPIPLIAVDRLSKLTDRQTSLIYRIMLSETRGSQDRTSMFTLQRGEID